MDRTSYEPHDIVDDEAALQGDAVELRLRAIEDALDRLADGRYGLCARCGGPIHEARLSALPAAATCLTCAA